MRFLLLNQFFPPDPAPTGILLHELAEELRRQGHEVIFVSSGEDYRSGPGQGSRMKREAIALLRMLRQALAVRRIDVVISETSPPCLLIVAALAALRHRARHYHWIMDLYPEIATALGELRPGWMPRLIGAMMGIAYRLARKVVVLDEDMANRLRKYGVEAAVVRPWVFASVQQTLSALRSDPLWLQPPADEPWTWIYSGNLGRGHEWQTLIEAQALIEKRDPEIRLRFQGRGPARAAAMARAAELGLQRCDWTDYVPEAELPASLLRCHAGVVTQLPLVQGMLWPSKLGLLLSLPRPIIWVGPVDGAIARELRAFPHAAVFAPGAASELADWLITQRQAPMPVEPAIDPETARQAALAEWMRILG